MRFVFKGGLLTAAVVVLAASLNAASSVVTLPESMPAELPMVLGGLGLYLWQRTRRAKR